MILRASAFSDPVGFVLKEIVFGKGQPRPVAHIHDYGQERGQTRWTRGFRVWTRERTHQVLQKSCLPQNQTFSACDVMYKLTIGSDWWEVMILELS